MKHMNKVAMMKLGWLMVRNPNDLWVKVLRAKFSCNGDIIPSMKNKRIRLNAWKGYLPSSSWTSGFQTMVDLLSLL